MSSLETYLRELRDIHATGENVEETSFYPALSNLLNAVGATLNPKVRIVINIKNRGAGLPDGGLFTAQQLKKAGGDEALREPAAFKGQQPERGVLEVKGAKDAVRVIAESEQVRRYLQGYGQVLVTNLRDFLLVTKTASGELSFGESYQLAASEKELWERVKNPQTFAKEHETLFSEYLKRVMLTPAPLEDPKDLAWFLASYARDAKTCIEAAELPSLHSVREAMEQALELKFEGERGEAFFRSTLVQTLFYGVFSAWVLWAKSAAAKQSRFDWRLAQWSLHVPVIRTLFEQVVTPSNVRGLGLEEVLNWTAETLNRVRRDSFFTRFEEEHAVQYFYEPFLEAFDPELRKQLGVWYTPEEIVRYMVERVDRVLRSELGIENGLADERVYVLDPCCGTGAYLVEVLRRIKQTIDEQGGDALTANDLKRAAQERVFGFEILPAPFVVAHLQLGLLLQKQGSALKDDERVGVYLTNALTGWEPPKEPKKQLAFAFHTLQEERDAAEQVKREKPILVVIGNPPYNGYAGTSTEEEQGLLEPYKRGLKEWGITKNYLDDLYVRFFRIAERRISEKTGKGIVCYISNHSWISDPTYVVLRQRLLESFDKFWIENMHGNRKISEYAPDGRTSETIFAIPGYSAGIQQGVVISLWVKKGSEKVEPTILFRDDLHAARAVERRQNLLESLDRENFNSQYQIVNPYNNNRFSFRPSNLKTDYNSWASVVDLSSVEPMLGLNDNRGQATHDIVKAEIVKRMQAYYNIDKTFDEVAALHSGLTTNAATFDAKATRTRLQKESGFKESNIVPFWFKPFDLRWAYIERISNLWNRVRPDLLKQAWKGNSFLLVRRHAPKGNDGAPFYFSMHIADQHVLHTDAYFIPLRLRASSPTKIINHQQDSFFADSQPTTTANLSERARAYLASLDINDPDANFETAALIWHHALAIGYAPAYLEENSDGIRADFPRIPLPASRELLEQSAALGKQIAALLDTETQVSGVTTGNIRPELRTIAVIRRTDGAGSLSPETGDLEVRAGWGHRGKGGVVMPGKGRLTTRNYTTTEQEALLHNAYEYPIVEGDTVALPNYPPPDKMIAALWGEQTRDVYLNDAALWANIPPRVWDYTIGGYQVIKKWLSYREMEILGRSLTVEEAREVTQMARRIAAILLLESKLNSNYQEVKGNSYDWKE